MTTEIHQVADQGSPALRMAGIRKTYRQRSGPDVVAVDGIDVTVQPGEIVAFLGPNGAGKTTTLDMVLGLIEPTSGHIDVLGMQPGAAVRAGKVSAVLQTGGLLRDLRVGETLQAIAALHGVEDRLPAVIDRTGLHSIVHRKVGLCSGGEQQRLRFALALLPNPDILILDEPTAGMDAAARRQFWETMQGETHEFGRTVIFATHYLEEAQAFAPRTVLINQGRIIADKPTDDLREAMGSRVVSASLPAQYVTDQSMTNQLVAVIQNMPGVTDVAVNSSRITVEASASDAVVLALLTSWQATDIEVSAPSLESAFFALTDHANTGAHSTREEN